MTDYNTNEQTPNSVVAMYTSENDVTAAVKHLKRKGFDMAKISVLGKGLVEERHIVGFETPSTHTARWAKWGAMWGWLFGALFFVPGVGSVAVGGYILYLLTTTGVGLAGGALTGALTASGIPEGGIPVYVADLRADKFLIIAHGSAADVDDARELLGHTAHDRLDVHGPPAERLARSSS